MLEKAVKYPLEREDYIKTLLIGSILLLTSVLIIPAIILVGYITKTIQHSSQNKQPPSITNFATHLKNGLKLIGLVLVYASIILILGLLTTATEQINETLAVAIFLITAVAYFGAIISYPSIVYHFSQKMSIKDGLQIREIASTVWNFQYLKVLIMLLVVSVIFSIIQILVAITIIGLLLLPATLIYELIVSAQLIGQLEE